MLSPVTRYLAFQAIQEGGGVGGIGWFVGVRMKSCGGPQQSMTLREVGGLLLVGNWYTLIFLWAS